jgi:hypothetical protein
MKHRKLLIGTLVITLLAVQAGTASAKNGSEDSSRTEVEVEHSRPGGSYDDSSDDSSDDSYDDVDDDSYDDSHDDSYDDSHDDSNAGLNDSSHGTEYGRPGSDHGPRREGREDQRRGEGGSASVVAWEKARRDIEEAAKDELEAARGEYKDARAAADTKAERELAARNLRESVRKIEIERRDALKQLGPKPENKSADKGAHKTDENGSSKRSDKTKPKDKNRGENSEKSKRFGEKSKTSDLGRR